MRRSEANAFQIKVFLIMLGLGTLAHELAWIDMFVRRDQTTLFSYLEVYKQLLPSPQIPGWLAGLDHVALITLALLMVLHRRRDLFAQLNAPVMASHLFIQGTKPANHMVVLIATYAVWFVYETLRRIDLRGRPSPEFAARNHRFLRLNAWIIMATTYVAAGLSKLNSGFFVLGESTATGFVWKFVSPFNVLLKKLLGETHPLVELAWNGYSILGMIFTLGVEFGLPLLLLMRPTRRWAFVMGLFFHLFILYDTAIDFSMVMLGIYPLIATADELGDFVGNYLRRPGRTDVLCGWGLALYLVAVHVHFHPAGLLRWMELYRAAHTLFLAYLGITAVRFALRWRHPLPRLLYDGQCALCRSAVGALRRWDGAGVRFEDLHAVDVSAAAGVSAEAVRRRMHLLVGRRISSGFKAFRDFAVYSGGPLTPLSVVLFVPGSSLLGQPLYDIVARRRHRWFRGSCASNRCPVADADR